MRISHEDNHDKKTGMTVADDNDITIVTGLADDEIKKRDHGYICTYIKEASDSRPLANPNQDPDSSPSQAIWDAEIDLDFSAIDLCLGCGPVVNSAQSGLGGKDSFRHRCFCSSSNIQILQ
jgi:hypothetical protein